MSTGHALQSVGGFWFCGGGCGDESGVLFGSAEEMVGVGGVGVRKDGGGGCLVFRSGEAERRRRSMHPGGMRVQVERVRTKNDDATGKLTGGSQ